MSGRGFFDKESLEFDCPECGRTVRTTVGDARKSRTVRCPGGHTIQQDGASLDRGARKMERSIENLLKRFG
jgi:hypothetical protein